MKTQHLLVPFPQDAYTYGMRSDGGTHGLVLTRPHVVELILDLAGYTSDKDLGSCRLLEPSCGHGVFLVAAVRRLLDSARKRNTPIGDLRDAILAFDINEEHVEHSRSVLANVLQSHQVDGKDARRLVTSWVRLGDFLLAPLGTRFDFVVGNPPYIRIEQLSPALQAEYRSRYSTLFDRADLYIAFIERGLRLLSSAGMLSFICADRWTLNRYGSPLRSLVSSEYEVRIYVDLHQASPFETEVIAYPSIFVIAKEREGLPVRVVRMSAATGDECETVANCLAKQMGSKGADVSEHATWFSGDEPWVLGTTQQIETLRTLESRFPIIEESGRTSVRIGVATGNDSVYIVTADADIEPDRLLPLVMRDDIELGQVKYTNRCVINTFADDGVIDLAEYPRLRRYLEQHEDRIRKRHVSRSNASAWFRTIDRVYPALALRPKLLIPDIAGSNEVAFEAGHYYPHHNLYFVISEDWDLEVLGGLLSSRVALFFVWAYAVKMRGGYLRFQAQYLRRIRVPQPESLSKKLKAQLKGAFRKRDFKALDQLACEAYGISAMPAFDFVDTRQ